PGDDVAFPGLNPLLDVEATRTHRSLRLKRDAPLRPLTATPLAGVGAVGEAITRRCVSDGRLNQQQRRCGEEQKAFHDILLSCGPVRWAMRSVPTRTLDR